MLINDSQSVITCSFGATSWLPGIERDSEALLRIADGALYEAKHQGRNRVVLRPAAK
jgi:PleD family two-component response regulator